MPEALYFTEDEAANHLLADDPFALLVGFALDQQVTAADLEPLFREKPAIHRFPGSMATRVRELAATVTEDYGGNAARVWTEADDGADLRRRIAALPGFGEMKVKSLGAVLAKRFGVPVAQELVPGHPTLGDVDSAQALTDYQAAKKAHKAEWLASKSAR